MASFVFVDPDGGPGPINAFPGSESGFANWASLRVESAGSLNRYTFDVDENTSAVWFLFRGSTAPTSWDQAIAVKHFQSANDITISFVAKTNSVR